MLFPMIIIAQNNKNKKIYKQCKDCLTSIKKAYLFGLTPSLKPRVCCHAPKVCCHAPRVCCHALCRFVVSCSFCDCVGFLFMQKLLGVSVNFLTL